MQTIRDKRYRIRERIKNALLDFVFLIDIRKEDREKVFQFLSEEGGPTLQSSLEFLYLGITDLDGDVDEELDLDLFVRMVETAITEGERLDRNYLASASVSIDVERTRPDTETLLDKMLDGRGSIEEFIYFIRNEGDRTALFASVVENEIPLVISSGTNEDEIELLSVERARELLENETEVLKDEDGEKQGDST